MREYKLEFDFTTFHKGSRFVGRSGECFVTAKKELTDADKTDDELLYMCSLAVHNLKPTWKIFSMTIKSIKLTPPLLTEGRTK